MGFLRSRRKAAHGRSQSLGKHLLFAWNCCLCWLLQVFVALVFARLIKEKQACVRSLHSAISPNETHIDPRSFSFAPKNINQKTPGQTGHTSCSVQTSCFSPKRWAPKRVGLPDKTHRGPLRRRLEGCVDAIGLSMAGDDDRLEAI